MSLWHLALATRETLRVSIEVLLETARGRFDPARCDRSLRDWAGKVISQAEMVVVATGTERAVPDETYVIMSNHQSLYDVPVLFNVLERRIRMVAKKELFRIPIWAQAMRRAGFVEVDRANRQKAIASLTQAQAALQAGTNIWIAPEGTRSRTGKLGPFKKGGFHLALDSGVRILPVCIDGTRAALPATGWRVHNGAAVTVTVCSPIDPRQYGKERLEDLMATVRGAISAHLPAALRDETAGSP